MLLRLPLPRLANPAFVRVEKISGRWWLCLPDLLTLSGFYGSHRRVQEFCRNTAEINESGLISINVRKIGTLPHGHCYFCAMDPDGEVSFINSFISNFEDSCSLVDQLEDFRDELKAAANKGIFEKAVLDTSSDELGVFLREINAKMNLKLFPLGKAIKDLRKALSSKRIRPSKLILCDEVFDQITDRPIRDEERIFFYGKLAKLVQQHINGDDKYRLTNFKQLAKDYIAYVCSFHWECPIQEKTEGVDE